MNQLNFVAVWVLHKGDHGRAASDGSGFSGDFSACLANFFASSLRIGHAQGNVAVSRAYLVGRNAVVISELNLRLVRVAGVADKGEVVFLLWALGGTKQLHAHGLGIARWHDDPGGLAFSGADRAEDPR